MHSHAGAWERGNMGAERRPCSTLDVRSAKGGQVLARLGRVGRSSFDFRPIFMFSSSFLKLPTLPESYLLSSSFDLFQKIVENNIVKRQKNIPVDFSKKALRLIVRF